MLLNVYKHPVPYWKMLGKTSAGLPNKVVVGLATIGSKPI